MTAKATQPTEEPRGEIDLYGEPVAKQEQEGVYYEAYNDDESKHIFVAKYVRDEERGWVKRGLEKLTLSEFFDYGFELRKGGR